MSQDLNDIEWTHLSRYLEGEGSTAEVERWISADPKRAVWVGQLRQVFDARQRVPDHWDVDVKEELQRFRARVKAQTDTEHAVSTGTKAVGTQRLPRGIFKTYPVHRGRRYTLAGIIAGASILVLGWTLGNGHLLRRMMTPTIGYTTYTTANGQRATITLPDGNSVVLNVASRLEVPTNYGDGDHIVRVPVGEALFTVSHHTGTPFTVVAGPAVTRVLGTSFVVRRYVSDTVTSIAVEDGKVQVGPAIVTARQMVLVGQHGEMQHRQATAAQFSFATGVLSLDMMRLSSAIPELDRWYNADIRLGDPTLATEVVYGKFTGGSLVDLTTILEMTFDVRVVRDGRVLTLYPKSR